MAGWTLVLALAFVPHTCLLSPVPRPVFTVTATAPDLVAVFSAGLTAGSQVTLKLMDNQVLKAEFTGLSGNHVIVRLKRTREQLSVPLEGIYSIHAKEGGAVVRP